MTAIALILAVVAICIYVGGYLDGYHARPKP